MTIQEVKQKIVNAIRDKHDLSIKQFADSEHPENAGIKGGSSLRCYLSSGESASTSFLTYKKLFKYLGLGELVKEQEVVKTVRYVVKAQGERKTPPKRTPPRTGTETFKRTAPPRRPSKVA